MVGGVLADKDLTGLALEAHRRLADVEIARRVADGTEHAAPVGVRAEHGGLEQGGVDDALGHGAGRRQVGRTGHGAFQQLRCALAVTGQLAAQMLGDLGQRGDKRIVIGRALGNFCAGQAAGQQQHGVVRGGIAVNRNLVEGGGHDGGQRLLQRGGRDLGVGGHKEQHRGHVRVDHAAALGDSADAHGLAADGKFQRNFLRMGVSGHDRGSRVVAAGLVGGQLGGGLRDALGERLDAHGLADDAGGGRQHVVRADAQLLGDDVAGVLSQLHAVGRAGVGVAAVHNDCLCIAVLQMLAVHRDGCAVDLVRGIAARARAADVRLDQRQVELGMVMADAAMHARRGKALRRTDAAGN